MNIMCLSIYVGLYWFSSLYFVIFTVQILSRFQFSSVQFSRSVVSDSLRPHEPQHARPPCPSPTPGVHPNPCPSSWRCHPTISSSVIPFSSCLQSFPASGSFPVSQLFASGGQSIGVSASTSVLPMITQDWSPLERTEVEAEAPTLWPPDAKSWLFGKDPNTEKDWGQEKWATENEIN